METKSKEQQSLLRKKTALKNIYSALLILSHHGEKDEFLSLIRAAQKHFELYKICDVKPVGKENVYDLSEYRKQREDL
jgi:hypothetical protein